jgi:hypothetical protein
MITREQLQAILSMMLLDRDSGDYHMSETIDTIMQLIEAQRPRWIYDRMPDEAGWYRVILKKNGFDSMMYFTPDQWHKNEWNVCVMCWLWHPEPVDEKEK